MSYKGCKDGDSIHSGRIDSYEPVIDKKNFHDVSSHELSGKDVREIFISLKNKMSDMGFKSQKDTPTIRSGEGNTITIRLHIKRFQQYDYVHPDTQVARIGALIQNIMILRTGDIRYLNFLSGRIRNNISALSKGYLKPYYSGKVIQDISGIVYDDLDEVGVLLNQNLSVINSKMESCVLESIEINPSCALVPSDHNIMVGVLDRSMFKDLVSRYQEWYSYDTDDVVILEQDIRASIHLMLTEKSVPKSSISIKIAQYKDKWLIGFSSVLKISPYLVLKKLYPKIKLNEIYNASQFVILGVFKDITSKQHQNDSKCVKCGDRVVYSLTDKRVSRVCNECLIKYYMGQYQYVNR